MVLEFLRTEITVLQQLLKNNTPSQLDRNLKTLVHVTIFNDTPSETLVHVTILNDIPSETLEHITIFNDTPSVPAHTFP